MTVEGRPPASAHPELVEGWPPPIRKIPRFLKVLPAILQQVQDERIYGFTLAREDCVEGGIPAYAGMTVEVQKGR